MKILNYGSLNIDYFFKTDHMVKPGETLSAASLEVQAGGKGLNQSIALSRAGAEAYHAGKVGSDGSMLIDVLKGSSVNTLFVTIDNTIKSGNAIIQIDKNGQNAIILYGGANQAITEDEIDTVLGAFSKGDYLLLQNEINNIDMIIKKASKTGLKIFINLAPITKAIASYPLDLVDCIIVNEIEGEELTGEADYKKIAQKITAMYPHAAVLLTLGANGSFYKKGDLEFYQPIYKADVINTTGAGDTFIGYFLSELALGCSIPQALDMAAKAAAISVSRYGSASSIPYKAELTTL